MVMTSGSASPPVTITPAKRRGGDGGQEGVRGGMEAVRRLGRRVKPFEQVGVLGFLAFTAGFFLLIFYFCSNRGGLSWAGRAAVGASGRGVKGAWGLGVEIGRSVGDDDGGSDAGEGGGGGDGGGGDGGVNGALRPGMDISRSVGGGGSGGGLKGAGEPGVDISRSVVGGGDGGVNGALGPGMDISRSVGGGGDGGVKGAWGPVLDINRSASAGGGGGGGGGVGARGGRECDWFEGKWVWDERYPLYESRDCRFLDDGFRCSENGRRDLLYSKWRWQPAACDLPRFDAGKMLAKLRNKRLVFVGDSIGRNQWESLLCMLSMAVPDKSSIYEVNGSPITKHKGFLVFRFRDYNCTVEYYRAPFLVLQSRPPAGVPKKVRTTLKLDIMDWMSSRWRDADVLIFNTGHWWNYEKTIRGGCYFQEGRKLKMDMSVDTAYERAIKTLFSWIHQEVNRRRTQVIFRTYAPVHFRGGDWKTGGSCHLEKFPELGPPVSLKAWDHLLKPFRNLTLEDSTRTHSTRTRTLELDVLNVTQMTARRRDGHLSIFYLGHSGLAPLHRQDCSHWCLPGVPDTWNELLYALFLKRESMIYQNVTALGNTRVKLDL